MGKRRIFKRRLKVHNAGLKVCAVYDKDSADDQWEICIADKCIITDNMD